MESSSAAKPMTEGRQYHLETRAGDIAPHCLLVGAPERAEMIATRLFHAPEKVGDHRGLKSYTGYYMETRISVVTTGMGGASVAITLPEAVRSGARRLIRVGSCGTLLKEADPGHSIIWTGACRYDGASDFWAPKEYPAIADYRLVVAMEKAAKELGHPVHMGIGATMADFYEGQARPDDEGYVPPEMLALYQRWVKCGVVAISMEEATVFTWVGTHGRRRREDGSLLYPGEVWAGAIDAVYANRVTDQFQVCGEEEAATIALNALLAISHEYPL